MIPRQRPLPGLRAVPVLAALGLALVLGAAPGCKSSEPEPRWIKNQVEAETDRLLLDVTAIALQKSSFPVGSGIDPGNLTIVSGWRTSLAPFRGEGYREQCEVHYERKAPRKYEVAIRVRHEKNDDLVRPLDITYAQWVQMPDDVDRARTVMQHIRSLLETDIQVDEKR